MEENKQLHVIFGTGPLGMATARAIRALGKPVRMVNRSGQAGELPAGVEVCRGDAYSVDEVRRLVQGAAAVYQCAQPPYHRWVEEFPALQAAILEGTAAAGARLVIGENLYMYGEVNGLIHEGLPYAAYTRKGKVRAQMAETAFAAHRAGKVRVTAARGSDFYGPGVLGSSLGERTFVPALQGKSASLTGRLDLPHSYTYIEDFGAALAILGQREEALGRAWHVPNAPAITQGEMMRIFFEIIGQPVRMSGMGKRMMQFGGLFVPAARETVEMMYEFERPFVVDSSAFEQTFGLQATPVQEGLRRTAEWYREHLRKH